MYWHTYTDDWSHLTTHKSNLFGFSWFPLFPKRMRESCPFATPAHGLSICSVCRSPRPRVGPPFRHNPILWSKNKPRLVWLEKEASEACGVAQQDMGAFGNGNNGQDVNRNRHEPAHYIAAIVIAPLSNNNSHWNLYTKICRVEWGYLNSVEYRVQRVQCRFGRTRGCWVWVVANVVYIIGKMMESIANGPWIMQQSTYERLRRVHGGRERLRFLIEND